MRRLHLISMSVLFSIQQWLQLRTGVFEPNNHHPIECLALDIAGRAQCFGGGFCCQYRSSGGSRVAIDIALGECEGQASKGCNSGQERSHLGYLAKKRE